MPDTHTWQPQWNLWHRITTALRAFEDSMDDNTDPLLRMEVADLNQVLPSLRDPATPTRDEGLIDALRLRCEAPGAAFPPHTCGCVPCEAAWELSRKASRGKNDFSDRTCD